MSWEKVKLGDLCTIEKGKTGIQKAIPGKYPLVVTAQDRKSHNEYQFDDEAVIIPLVSGTGHGHASIKRLHYQTGKFALGSILCAVIPKNKSVLNAEYLFRFLNLNKERELVDRMKGMANVTLPIKEIAKIEIPVPGLKEQIKFVEKYGLLETDSQDIEEELNHQLDLVKQLRQSFLREAMQGKLCHAELVSASQETGKQLLEKIKAEKAQLIVEKKLKKEKPLAPITDDEIPFEIPEHWTWCRLGEIYSTTSGGTPLKGNQKYWNGNITWYKSGELNDGFLSIDSSEKITEIGLKESSATLFPIGTLLIAMYGATAGKLAILEREASTNQAVCGFYNNKKIETKYLFWFLLSNRNKLIKESWGMSQPNISQTYLRNFVFPLPPLYEQEQIVAKLEELMEFCDGLEQSIRESQCLNEKLLQQVLREALQPKNEKIITI